MGSKGKYKRGPGARAGSAPARRREPLLAQIAGFVDLFIWLLVLKSFFLPLFVIPTGSMAETLAGAHATHTCPNCGFEYTVGFRNGSPAPAIQCPNCRYREASGATTCPRCGRASVRPFRGDASGWVLACQNPQCPPPRYQLRIDSPRPATRVESQAGDRIVVHGWPFAFGGALGPQRWDVVVFKVPKDGQTNYIKRLIGLPGDKVEIIDGDIFINDRIARKTRYAQRALWLPYYDHDCLPRQPSAGAGYHPRWVARQADGGWSGLDTRVLRFDGVDRPRAEIQFTTYPGDDRGPGLITDVYGYDPPGQSGRYPVGDVRLSAELTIVSGDGYVELSTTKYADRFYARLYADGLLTLEHGRTDSAERQRWGEAHLGAPPDGVRLALSNVDYVVSVEVDGEPLITSTPTQYGIVPARARANAGLPPGARVPWLRVSAERVRASLARVLIERDVYYTPAEIRQQRDGAGRPRGGRPGHGTAGNPIQLGNEYFVLGDNSPASLDSRLWRATELGPHLRKAFESGQYQIGTVPADQMIGRAFFVYWPGFLPLYPGGPNLLPNLGRARWIH